MAVTKHPDPWIDKAYEGKYINVETKDYSNSHAKTDSKTGKVELDKYGKVVPSDDNSFAHPAPFYKLNDDGTYLDGNTQIKDKSGEAYVQRVQGNQYTYFEGSVFSFNSTCDYNFGNNYEENHGWSSDHVPYDSSDQNPPTTEHFVIPTLGTDLETQQGIVTKTWGNEYNFNYGTSRNWSGGPAGKLIDDNGGVTNDNSASADLKSGKLREYSYGSGYEEVLIDQNDGDADQHYPSTKHNDWKAKKLKNWPSDPANILVSKVFGRTYDYRHGDAFEVREGAAEEHIHGDSYSYVYGDNHEYVGDEKSRSNSYATVYGDSKETIFGVTTEYFWGRKSEVMGGGVAALNMGGMIEMTLGAVEETTLSAKMEIALGAFLEICMGLKTEVFIGGLIEIAAGAKAEISAAEECDLVGGAKIEAVMTKIQAVIGPKLISAPLNVNVP